MRALFPLSRPKDNDLLAAARLLFSDGIGLASYTGPAALLRGDGGVLIANSGAANVADPLGMGTKGQLHPSLAGAIRSGNYTTAAITLDASAGDDLAGVTFDFTVLPVIRGETALVIGRDTALESAFRGALTESRQRYKELVDICGDFCWETDAAGRFAFVSPGGALDYAADDLVRHDPVEYFDPLLRDMDGSPFTARTSVNRVDVWFRRADGTYACLETSARPIDEHSAASCAARGVCRDVTAYRQDQETLSRIQIRDRLIAHVMRTIRDEVEPDKMLGAAAQAVSQAMAAQGCRVYRDVADKGLVAAADYGTASPADEVIAGALMQAKRDGRPFAAQHGSLSLLCVATSYRQEGNGALVVWREVDDGGWSPEERGLAGDVGVQLGVAIQQIRNQLELEILSRTDTLTGLLNRRAFTTELDSRINRPDSGTAGSLFYVDLDNFKPVNDILGHQKGDEALIAVAEMLVRSTRPGDLVARLGGDEFALWLDRTDDEAAKQRAMDLLDGASCLEPFSGDPAKPLGVSIGVAVSYPCMMEDLEGLMARADAAMYDVKHNGKAGYIIAAVPEAKDSSEKRAASA
jgi:diguanylate cyclase (GGDEF)-like protein/PAS domain S-box-containing protein